MIYRGGAGFSSCRLRRGVLAGAGVCLDPRFALPGVPNIFGCYCQLPASHR